MQSGKYDDRGKFWQAFGPGVLFAGAAIGTSHLVQSTRAGAVFGLGLLGIIIFANFIKYPAFRFGPQYAAATGKSLIDGYFAMGRWVLVLYLLGEIAVMVIIIAATATVTAAILMGNIGVAADIRYMSIGLIVLGVLILGFGGYQLLDRLNKIFVAILTVATVLAAVISLPRVEWEFGQILFPLSDLQTLGFVIALMGFMPSALDLAVLQSLWSVAKQKASGVRPSMQHAMTDFNIGYVVSAVLAICFLIMGAGVMHSAGEPPAAGAAAFAEQVINLYTSNLGRWTGALVGISAMLIMFTTLNAVLDGFPRLLATSMALLIPNPTGASAEIEKSPLLRGSTLFLVIAAALALMFLMSSFQTFIDFVTITAFVVSPITAVLNHLVMFSPNVPAEHRPTALLRNWSLLGIVALSGLALVFVYVRFF